MGPVSGKLTEIKQNENRSSEGLVHHTSQTTSWIHKGDSKHHRRVDDDGRRIERAWNVSEPVMLSICCSGISCRGF